MKLSHLKLALRGAFDFATGHNTLVHLPSMDVAQRIDLFRNVGLRDVSVSLRVFNPDAEELAAPVLIRV